jgi:hypothetical protein
MPSHFDYIVVRQHHRELAQQAERARQARGGERRAPAGGRRGLAVRLFARLRISVRRPDSAPASTR